MKDQSTYLLDAVFGISLKGIGRSREANFGVPVVLSRKQSAWPLSTGAEKRGHFEQTIHQIPFVRFHGKNASSNKKGQ